jgi:opacity protein-like surface antigen
MKRILHILVFLTLIIKAASAQDVVPANLPYVFLNSSQGYVMINHLAGGIGLGDTRLPFAKGYFGLSTVHGYQLMNNFFFGGGTGIYFYNKAIGIPVFAEVRARYFIKPFTPYLFGDGGFVFYRGISSKIFINPGAGVNYGLNNKLALDFGMGLMVQWDSWRDAYINFKLGVLFKPGK